MQYTKREVKQDSIQLIQTLAAALDAKKGVHIMAIDLRGVSSLTDFFLIAEGTVERHVIALGKTVVETLRSQGITPVYTEGLNTGDWVVIDSSDLVVHLLTATMRDKYRLEQLWQGGQIIDLDLKEHQVAL